MKTENLVYVWDLKEIWWVCRNRWNRCVEWTNKKMGMAVGALFIRDNFNHESKVRLLLFAKMHCHFTRKSASKLKRRIFVILALFETRIFEAFFIHIGCIWKNSDFVSFRSSSFYWRAKIQKKFKQKKNCITLKIEILEFLHKKGKKKILFLTF